MVGWEHLHRHASMELIVHTYPCWESEHASALARTTLSQGFWALVQDTHASLLWPTNSLHADCESLDKSSWVSCVSLLQTWYFCFTWV